MVFQECKKSKKYNYISRILSLRSYSTNLCDLSFSFHGIGIGFLF